jgi:hypothetical protein
MKSLKWMFLKLLLNKFPLTYLRLGSSRPLLQICIAVVLHHLFQQQQSPTLIQGQNLLPIFEQEDDEGLEDGEEAIEHPRLKQTIQRDHPVDNILGSLRKGVLTHSYLANFYQYYSFVSPVEPLKVEKTLEDEDWVVAMQEELNNFERNQVWTLVERPKTNVIGTKWVFHNKQDENGVVTRNKARLVA